MKYQILMDSCGDLSEEMKECREIVSVPLRIRVGKEEMMDDEKLDSRELLKKIHGESGVVGSSCPSPSQFVECCDREAEHVYILTGSSVLTGSYTSARIAAELMREAAEEEKRNQQITVIDSKSASAGQTFLAMQIMHWEKEGEPLSAIRKRLKKWIRAMQTRFVLEDLNMLEKSGRLTGLRAKAADMFHICPLLEANGHGAIRQCGQARGIRKALHALQKRVLEDLSGGVCGPLVVSHCHCPERAFALKIAIHDRFPDVPVRIVATRGIASMYAGKGGIVVAYVPALNKG